MVNKNQPTHPETVVVLDIVVDVVSNRMELSDYVPS